MNEFTIYAWLLGACVRVWHVKAISFLLKKTWTNIHIPTKPNNSAPFQVAKTLKHPWHFCHSAETGHAI